MHPITKRKLYCYNESPIVKTKAEQSFCYAPKEESGCILSKRFSGRLLLRQWRRRKKERNIHNSGCICRFALGFCKNKKKRTETLYQSFSPFMVGLSETFSNNYKIIRDYVKNHASTPVNTDIDPAITDQSYNPDYIVKSIKQQQKTLTEYEIQSIIQKYQNGASSYDLAKEFGCHRRTITDTLKRNGVEVSHQAATKPELVKRIIELYAEMKTPKEVGAIAGINEGTVRQILKKNNIHIRRSWEYPRSK